MHPDQLKSLYYRFANRFQKPVNLPVEADRRIADLPVEGRDISVEKALNSRCSSDYDDNPKVFHWGMFDKTRRLSNEQVEEIIALSEIPGFTGKRSQTLITEGELMFVVDRDVDSFLKDPLMVESGMHQQALGLVCAALGVGMVIHNMGIDGRPVSDEHFATVKARLDPMKPSFDGKFWSGKIPRGWKSWKSGNLPDPVRDGNKPLISTMADLRQERQGNKEFSKKMLSQLLWAARGRTPHYYKSKPWGMTIPTWAGIQDLSDVCCLFEGQLYQYENWKNDHATHNLALTCDVDSQAIDTIFSSNSAVNGMIILVANEHTGRALWEVGYQLLNIIVQATSLDISFSSVLLSDEEKDRFKKIKIDGAVALVAL